MENLPLYLSLLFGATALLTAYIFFKAMHWSKIALFAITGWLILQSIIGLFGFYTVTDTIPPRFLLLVLPPLLCISILFATHKGRNYIDSFDAKTLTLLHVVRIPVELVLFGLFTYKAIPQLMTFEGRNFDILSGITAPLIWYFGFIKRKISRQWMIAWNVICLGLLINIVTNAILAAPFTFQQFAFDQPNIAVFYFPYVWLPGFIVPLVLFSHLVTLRHLIKTKRIPATDFIKIIPVKEEEVVRL